MAVSVLYTEGFEAGDYSLQAAVGWTLASAAITSTYGNVHQNSIGDGGKYSVWSRGGSTPTFPTTGRWVFMWINKNPPSPPRWEYRYAGLAQFGIHVDSDGYVRLYLGNGGGALATSAAPVNTNVAHWYAIYLNCTGSGLCRVFVDGAEVVNYTGNTQAQASSGWTSIYLYGGTGVLDAHIDDFVITDDDGGLQTTTPPFPLEFYLAYQRPRAVSGNTGGRATSNLTGHSATGSDRYQNVDDDPYDASNYNYASAANDEDLYELTAPPAPDVVYFIGVNVVAARAGSIGKVQPSVYTTSDSAMHYGASYPLPASPGVDIAQAFWVKDPGDNASWTESKILALEAGAKFTV